MAISGPQWCIEGLRVTADAVVKTNATPEILSLRLFSDNITVADTSVLGDFTLITTAGGEAVTLAKATWVASTNADPVVSVYNTGTGVVYTITGALTVYGWLIVGNTSSKVYAAENFGVNTVANGNTITINPIQLNFDIPE